MDIFAYSMLCFTSLFTLMDPLGVMPVFLQMTEGMSAARTPEHRLKMIPSSRSSYWYFSPCAAGSCSIFSGSQPMVSGLRGGIIIFKIGYDMLQAHFTHVKLNENEKKEYSRNITVTPLAVPMLCGPGVISSGITLMEDAPEAYFQNCTGLRDRPSLSPLFHYPLRVNAAFENSWRNRK